MALIAGESQFGLNLDPWVGNKFHLILRWLGLEVVYLKLF